MIEATEQIAHADTGREFQIVGPAIEKARPPRTVPDLGMTRQRQSDELIE